jgi:hypothetical protein
MSSFHNVIKLSIIDLIRLSVIMPSVIMMSSLYSTVSLFHNVIGWVSFFCLIKLSIIKTMWLIMFSVIMFTVIKLSVILRVAWCLKFTFQHSVFPNDKLQLLWPRVDEARPVCLKQDIAAIPSLEPVGLGSGANVGKRFIFVADAPD